VRSVFNKSRYWPVTGFVFLILGYPMQKPILAAMTATMLTLMASASSQAADVALLSELGSSDLSRSYGIINQDGNDQSALIDQVTFGNAGGNHAEITQKGYFNVAAITQRGDANSSKINQTGTSNTANSMQFGTGNTIDLTQSGDFNYFDGRQYGNYNTIIMTQPGQASAIVSETGDHNVIQLNLNSSQKITIDLVGNGRQITATTN